MSVIGLQHEGNASSIAAFKLSENRQLSENRKNTLKHLSCRAKN